MLGFSDDLLTTYDAYHLLVPSVLVRIVQIGIGIALIFSFPVLAFELRHCVDALLFPHSTFSWIRHTLENICIIAVALAVGILVPSVVTVFGFVGATTSSTYAVAPASVVLTVAGVVLLTLCVCVAVWLCGCVVCRSADCVRDAPAVLPEDREGQPAQRSGCYAGLLQPRHVRGVAG